jgi:methyl-accepting chemotaxis protein
MGKKDRRLFRNYFISIDLQVHLLAKSLIYMVIIVIVAVGIVLYPLISDMIFTQDMERQYQAAQTLIKVAQWLIPTVMIMLVLFMGHMILVTQRICGPLVNFTHTFDKLAEGDLTRKVRLRNQDYLKSECERINRMIEGISGIITRLTTDHERLMATLQDLKEQARDLDTKDQFDAALEMVWKDAKCVSDTLSQFKVEDPGRITDPVFSAREDKAS